MWVLDFLPIGIASTMYHPKETLYGDPWLNTPAPWYLSQIISIFLIGNNKIKSMIIIIFYQMITIGYEYCYLDCKSMAHFVFNLFDVVVALAITLYVIRNMIVARQTRDYTKTKFIYLLMLIWGISRHSSIQCSSLLVFWPCTPTGASQ